MKGGSQRIDVCIVLQYLHRTKCVLVAYTAARRTTDARASASHPSVQISGRSRSLHLMLLVHLSSGCYDFFGNVSLSFWDLLPDRSSSYGLDLVLPTDVSFKCYGYLGNVNLSVFCRCRFSITSHSLLFVLQRILPYNMLIISRTYNLFRE